MEYKYVIFVTFVLSSILTLAKSECLDGWVPHLESCYLFVLDMTETWPEAQEICAVFGGRLVEVETQEEEYFINSQLQRWGLSTSDQRRLWLGGNDIQQEGDWIWASDERAIKGQQYSDWAPGQPDNHNMQGHAEHCMTLVPAYGFHWNDEECSVKNYLICEKPRTPSAGNILG